MIKKNNIYNEDLANFKFIVEHSNEEFYQLNIDGSFVYVNPAALKNLGYSFCEILQLNLADIDININESKLNKIIIDLKSEKSSCYRTIHKRKSGELVHKEFSAFYHKYNDIEYICGFARDITKRVKAENELKNSEEKFRTIFNNSPTGILMADEKGYITQINDAYITMLGGLPSDVHKIREINLLNFEIFMQSGIQSYFYRLYQGIPFNIEVKLPKSFFNKTVYLLYIGIPLFDENGKVKGCIINTKDITDRKLVELSLKDEKKLFFGGPTVVMKWKFADKYPIEYVSPNVERLIGYSDIEILQDNTLFYDLIHKDDLSVILAETKDYVAKGVNSYEHEYRLKRRDGTYCWVNDFTTTIKNNKGDVTHLHGYLVDITDKKKREAAESASKEKSKFLANMSHEIRNPLNVIIGISRLLKRTYLNIDQMKLVESLNISSQHLMALVNDVLDFSKIEAGKIELKLKYFSLNEMMGRLNDMFLKDIKKKKLDLLFDIDKNLADTYSADSDKLFQIFVNLISNAIKFTNSGSIIISVKSKKRTQEIEVIDFVVSDTGIGIDKNDLDKMFESFRQLDESPSKEYRGTGLGLSIVKGYVNIMGGTISAESSKGKGTNISFDLPLRISERESEKYYSIVDNIDKYEENIDKVNIKILVAEDDKLNQFYLKELLSEEGFEVQLASTGVEAVDKSKHFEFDVILMDGQMPVMDGFTAAKNIRQDNTNPNFDTPIIAITGYATTEDENNVLNSGMNYYITKPINENELFSVIKKLLATKKSAN